MKAWLDGLSPSRRDWLAGILLALAIVLAYGDSLHGPLIFDDVPAIRHNPTIRSLWPPWGPLFPPIGGGLTVGGRPILNFSLALNYAFGGTEVIGYHLANLAIHLAAALLLFAIVLRTLRQPALASAWGEASRPIALASALIWGLHPLQTEAVTYIIQRAESLVGLCYLLTLYTFIRGTEEEALASLRARRWFALSLAACFLGMAVKEVMATAPLLVFLYDRTFVAGTFREAWRRRRPYYLALASSWLLLGWLVLGTHGRGATAGFDIYIPWWVYALRQFQSILAYLRLALWPYPITFDSGYCSGPEVTIDLWKVLPAALVIVILLAATIWALRHRPRLGFLGAWFFLILAPSSSIVPVDDIRMEHRIYLSLAAPAVLAAILIHRWLGKRSRALWLLLIIVLGTMTWRRNLIYRSELTLWTDTVRQSPANAHAHLNLSRALTTAGQADAGRSELAIAQHLQESSYATALAQNPDDLHLHIALAKLLFDEGKEPEGRAQIEAALRLAPENPEVLDDQGMRLLRSGQTDQALQKLTEAARQPLAGPRPPDDLGVLLIQLGRLPEAVMAFECALRADPLDASANANLGNALLQQGDLSEAVARFQTAIGSDPSLVRAHFSLALALAYQHRYEEASAECRETLNLAPDHAGARALLQRLGQ